eukprot:528766_1
MNSSSQALMLLLNIIPFIPTVAVEQQYIESNQLLKAIDEKIEYLTDQLNELVALKMELLTAKLSNKSHPLLNLQSINNITTTANPTLFPTSQPTNNPTNYPTTIPIRKKRHHRHRGKRKKSMKNQTSTQMPTISPTLPPTIQWDKDNISARINKIEQRRSRKCNQQNNNSDESILRAMNPNIIKLYSIVNKDLHDLELELLSDPTNDLVIVSTLKNKVLKDRKSRSAEQYFSIIDDAFDIGKVFV